MAVLPLRSSITRYAPPPSLPLNTSRCTSNPKSLINPAPIHPLDPDLMVCLQHSCIIHAHFFISLAASQLTYPSLRVVHDSCSCEYRLYFHPAGSAPLRDSFHSLVYRLLGGVQNPTHSIQIVVAPLREPMAVSMPLIMPLTIFPGYPLSTQPLT